MDMKLKTKDLSVFTDQKELLHKVSLNIPEGSFVGLMGANGSGKSTLLKTIYRFNKATEGTVYIDGKKLEHMTDREIAKQMAVVTQENEIHFDFTVMELMMIGRYAHHNVFSKRDGRDERICREALELVGMAGFEKRSFLSLSGGEKQRVLIASAFSRETQLLILDEPTNHLDLGYQFLIMDLLKKQKDVTVFMAVHDINMAFQYCDYVIVLDQGKVAAAGNPEEALTEGLLSKIFRIKTEMIRDQKGTKYIKYLGYNTQF